MYLAIEEVFSSIVTSFVRNLKFFTSHAVQTFFQTNHENQTASISSNKEQGNTTEDQSKHIRATKIVPRNQLTLEGDHEWNQSKFDRSSDLSFNTAPRSSKHRPKGIGTQLHQVFPTVANT